MAPDVLVHLIEPAAWRAALSDGAVRPPSLDAVGFVHLSTPEQVHLPAERLYPGRRDLVLLVVDPARLTDPVRFEDGVPADPGGMLFPHLYGPLPVSAVTAVVPYRPPAPFSLPAPGDRLGRALAYLTSVPIRRAVGVGDVPGRRRRARPRPPLLARQQPPGPDRSGRRRHGGTVRRRGGGQRRLAAPGGLAAVARRGRRGRRAGTPRVEHRGTAADGSPGHADRRRRTAPRSVDQREVHEFWERSWRRDLPAGPEQDRVVADLIGREHLNDRVVAVTDLVVRESGRVVASGQLRVDGATAAVDSVLTDPAARGRGHADAVLARRWTGRRPPGATSSSWRRRPRTGRGTGTPGAASSPSARSGGSTDAPERLDGREDRQQEIGHRGRRQQRVQPVHQPAVAGEQVAHVLDAQVALDQRLAQVADGGGHRERRTEHQPAPPGRVEGEQRAAASPRSCRRSPTRRSPPTTSSG